MHISEKTMLRFCKILPPYLTRRQRLFLVLRITRYYWLKPHFSTRYYKATWETYPDVIEKIMIELKDHSIQDDIITKCLSLPDFPADLVRIFVVPDLLKFWHQLNRKQYENVVPDVQYVCHQLYIFKVQAVNKMLADDIYDDFSVYIDRQTLSIALTITRKKRTLWQKICRLLKKLF